MEAETVLALLLGWLLGRNWKKFKKWWNRELRALHHATFRADRAREQNKCSKENNDVNDSR